MTPKKAPTIRPLSIAPVRETDELIELVAPYRSYAPRRLPDPRTAGLPEISKGLETIVAAEGPMLDHRAFALYTRAAKLSRATAEIRGRYVKAVARSVKEGGILSAPDDPRATGRSAPQVLRAPGARPVHLRARADRTLEEIPLGEIAALFRKLELGRGESFASPEERLRRVLGVYDLVRLTPKSKARLEEACSRARLPEWSNAISEGFEPVVEAKAPRPFKIPRRLRHG